MARIDIETKDFEQARKELATAGIILYRRKHRKGGYVCRASKALRESLKIVENMTSDNTYPLYDVPYLARDPNDFHMSAARHAIEVRNQAVVDDYFIARDKGASASEARKQVAAKHGIPTLRVLYSLRWFYQEAVRRRKYSFLQKFPPTKEHIVQY